MFTQVCMDWHFSTHTAASLRSKTSYYFPRNSDEAYVGSLQRCIEHHGNEFTSGSVCLNSLYFFSLSIVLQKDFHYEYTECDSDGGRWRVSVPRPDFCVGGAPNPPIRGKGCGMCFYSFYICRLLVPFFEATSSLLNHWVCPRLRCCHFNQSNLLNQHNTMQSAQSAVSLSSSLHPCSTCLILAKLWCHGVTFVISMSIWSLIE